MNNYKKLANRFQVLLTMLVLFSLFGCGGGGSSETVMSEHSEENNARDEEIHQIRQSLSQLKADNPIVDLAQREKMLELINQARSNRNTFNAKVAIQARQSSSSNDPLKNYLIHYGTIDAAFIEQAKTYELVILHPSVANLTQAMVSEIQQGVDPATSIDDVIVLLYVSVGEDLRTIGVSDEQMLQDPRFVGNGQGPRVDPRGVFPNGGQNLRDIPPLGNPSPGGLGYASFYLDDNSVVNDPNQIGDGKPDRNAHFGGAFVNAGDPLWFDVVDQMSLDGIDGITGFKEALTDSFGRGLNADGIFLDTIDTAAPNFYTDDSSSNQSEYEWTAPGFSDFIRRLKVAYPDKLVLQNRGLFFFDPRLPHYQYHAGELIDYFLFESYRLNSNAFETYNLHFFLDNKYNYAPKLMAEASRDNGFTVLSLGYAEGPSINLDTLIGDSSEGYNELIDDIVENEDLAGFKHYITNAAIDLNNDFVKNHGSVIDQQPPAWSSTYNAFGSLWPNPPQAPDPRVGIQAITASENGLMVHWDVALDKHAVSYHLYYQTTPFDFNADPNLNGANKVKLKKNRGKDYGEKDLALTYAFQDEITGLSSGQTYHMVIRAEDHFANEEKNEVVLSAATQAYFAIDGIFSEWQTVVPVGVDPSEGLASAGPDYELIKHHVESDLIYMYVKTHNEYNLDGSPDYAYSRSLIFIDVDNDPSTGYAISGAIGSDVVINGELLFKQTNNEFNAGYIGQLNVAGTFQSDELEIALPLNVLTPMIQGNSVIKVVYLNDEIGDYVPAYGNAYEIEINPQTPPQEVSVAPIVIDGNFSEWQPYPLLYDDPDDAPISAGPDWLEIKATCDDNYLHLYFTSDNSFNLDGSPTYGFSRSLIFFDTDEDPSTGYAINGLGSDVVLNGGNLFAQGTHLFNAGLIDSAIRSEEYAIDTMELSIPLSSLDLAQDQRWMRFFFVNDETYDLAPNNNAVFRLNMARCKSTVVQNNDFEPIAIDGNFQDWDKVPLLYRDTNDVPVSAGPDWLDIKMDHDEAFLYFYMSSSHVYNLNGSPDFEYSRQLIFIDVDNDSSTGFPINGIGSDVVINGQWVFSQTQNNFAEAYLGQMTTSGTTQIDRLEMKFDRTLLLPLANPKSAIKVLFVNDQVNDFAPEIGSVLTYDYIR